jgi:acetyl-CoA hydrolase
VNIVAPEALDFAALIRPGERVFWAEATAEPVLLTRLLETQAGRCPPFRVFYVLRFGQPFAAAHAHVTVAAGGRAAHTIPANISDLAALIGGGALAPDIVLLQVCGPDPAGNYNTGIGVEFLPEAIAAARLVVAQRNPLLPWVEGDTLVAAEDIDILVPAPHPPLEPAPRPAGPVEAAIAGHVARLVSDRATIELGLGAIPEAVTRALAGKTGLGIHSGMIGDGVMALMEAGVIDNRHKEDEAGVSVATMLMGSKALYRWAGRNPRIRLRAARHTHDALAMGRFRRFTAINSALEIDLTGQANAELSGGRQIGLVGGQMDFVRAANRAPEGRSIIALPATDRGGTRSRIVARLADGIVTTPRAEADCVVTEYGIAELRGRTLGERARALTAIAAPAFRAGLAAAAERLA